MSANLPETHLAGVALPADKLNQLLREIVAQNGKGNITGYPVQVGDNASLHSLILVIQCETTLFQKLSSDFDQIQSTAAKDGNVTSTDVLKKDDAPPEEKEKEKEVTSKDENKAKQQVAAPQGKNDEDKETEAANKKGKKKFLMTRKNSKAKISKKKSCDKTGESFDAESDSIKKDDAEKQKGMEKKIMDQVPEEKAVVEPVGEAESKAEKKVETTDSNDDKVETTDSTANKVESPDTNDKISEDGEPKKKKKLGLKALKKSKKLTNSTDQNEEAKENESLKEPGSEENTKTEKGGQSNNEDKVQKNEDVPEEPSKSANVTIPDQEGSIDAALTGKINSEIETNNINDLEGANPISGSPETTNPTSESTETTNPTSESTETTNPTSGSTETTNPKSVSTETTNNDQDENAVSADKKTAAEEIPKDEEKSETSDKGDDSEMITSNKTTRDASNDRESKIDDASEPNGNAINGNDNDVVLQKKNAENDPDALSDEEESETIVEFTEEQKNYINAGKSFMARKCRRRRIRRMASAEVDDIDTFEIIQRIRAKTKRVIDRQTRMISQY